MRGAVKIFESNSFERQLHNLQLPGQGKLQKGFTFQTMSSVLELCHTSYFISFLSCTSSYMVPQTFISYISIPLKFLLVTSDGTRWSKYTDDDDIKSRWNRGRRLFQWSITIGRWLLVQWINFYGGRQFRTEWRGPLGWSWTMFWSGRRWYWTKRVSPEVRSGNVSCSKCVSSLRHTQVVLLRQILCKYVQHNPALIQNTKM